MKHIYPFTDRLCVCIAANEFYFQRGAFSRSSLSS